MLGFYKMGKKEIMEKIECKGKSENIRGGWGSDTPYINW